MEKRKYISGDEWLYLKVYSGDQMLEKILSNIIVNVGDHLMNNNLMDKWFYIRYRDMYGSHLRLRYHSLEESNLSLIQKILTDSFCNMMNSKEIAGITFDTYSREYERYGESIYSIIETIFYVDSSAVLALLSFISRIEDKENRRWQIALLLIDDLLDAYNMDLENKLDVIGHVRDSFRNEMGFISLSYIRQLNDKYRNFKTLVQQAMKRDLPHDMVDILKKRKENLIEIISCLNRRDKKLLDNSLGSIMHMSMNRLFVSSNRLCEMIIYDFLYRVYRSQIAQKNN